MIVSCKPHGECPPRKCRHELPTRAMTMQRMAESCHRPRRRPRQRPRRGARGPLPRPRHAQRWPPVGPMVLHPWRTACLLTTCPPPNSPLYPPDERRGPIHTQRLAGGVHSGLGSGFEWRHSIANSGTLGVRRASGAALVRHPGCGITGDSREISYRARRNVPRPPKQRQDRIEHIFLESRVK